MINYFCGEKLSLLLFNNIIVVFVVVKSKNSFYLYIKIAIKLYSSNAVVYKI